MEGVFVVGGDVLEAGSYTDRLVRCVDVNNLQEINSLFGMNWVGRRRY